MQQLDPMSWCEKGAKLRETGATLRKTGAKKKVYHLDLRFCVNLYILQQAFVDQVWDGFIRVTWCWIEST